MKKICLIIVAEDLLAEQLLIIGLYTVHMKPETLQTLWLI
jgi:hypothetical protein